MNIKAQMRQQMDEVMRKAVYEASIELLKTGSKLVMSDVAKKAGVAKGTLYNYFENKDDLIDFVHDSATAPVAEALAVITEENIPAGEKLEKIGKAIFQAVYDNSAVFDLICEIQTVATTWERKRAAVEKWIIPVFRKGIEDGEIYEKLNPERAAYAFFGSLIGILEGCHDNEQILEARNDFDAIMHTIKYGMIRREQV